MTNKTIIIRTNWDKKQKKGGWAAICVETGKTISDIAFMTTSDKLSLMAMTEATKAFGGTGIKLRFVNKNGRAVAAIRKPSSSVNCAYGREFRATARATGSRWTFR